VVVIQRRGGISTAASRGPASGWIVAAALCVPLAAHAQQKHLLECPREAPPEWGLPKPAPLEQPAVLSQPNGEPIDETAPPSLMPDQLPKVRS
jgi:hypothetical protein